MPPNSVFGGLELYAREELADLIAFWHHRGFGLARTVPHGVILTKILPLAIEVPTAEDMQRLGARLATVLQQGDVIVASGELGAGKTTLAQGLGRSGQRRLIISPTFVRPGYIDPHWKARPRPCRRLPATSAAGWMILIWTRNSRRNHACRMGARAGRGLAEDRLEIDIRPAPNGDHDARMVLIRGVGRRWHHVDLEVPSVTVEEVPPCSASIPPPWSTSDSG